MGFLLAVVLVSLCLKAAKEDNLQSQIEFYLKNTSASYNGQSWLVGWGFPGERECWPCVAMTSVAGTLALCGLTGEAGSAQLGKVGPRGQRGLQQWHVGGLTTQR